MNTRQLARLLVEKNSEYIHEVYVDGELFVASAVGIRRGAVVILTYSRGNTVLQGVGASYFNPHGKSYNCLLGYRIAKGRAVVSLGTQLITGIHVPLDVFNRALTDSVHLLPGDTKWKPLRKRQKNTKSQLRGKSTTSQKATERVVVVTQYVPLYPSSRHTSTTNATQDAPSVGRGFRVIRDYGSATKTFRIIGDGEGVY